MGELASAGQIRMALLRRALITVPVTVLLGLVVGSVSNAGNGNRWYAMLVKPWFQPPGWAFPVVWTILYIMLGLALAVVLNARGSGRITVAVVLFVLQFALNLAWSPIFFGLHQVRLGLIVILVLLAVAGVTTLLFWRIRRSAGLLMLPYLAWLTIAAALNYETMRLNPNAETLVVAPPGAQIQLKH